MTRILDRFNYSQSSQPRKIMNERRVFPKSSEAYKTRQGEEKMRDLRIRYRNSLSVDRVFAKQLYSELIASSASGSVISDYNGKKYLDFAQSMVLLGHSNRRVASKLKAALPQYLVGGIPGWSLVEPRVRFAEKLKSHLPSALRKNGRIAYCSSGAEACDYALGVARQSTRRKVIISFVGGYHGFTGATLSVNGIDPYMTKYRIAGRLGTVTIPYPDCYHHPEHKEPQCAQESVDSLSQVLETTADPNDVAGIIFESIEVMGGLLIPHRSFWKEIFRICRREGILTIADEVFTGIGKTGKFLAIDHYGVEPDIVCLGKGVGGTLPLGVIAASKDILNDNIKPNSNSSSAGNPLSCLAGEETLNIIEEDNLMQRASNMGEYIRSCLSKLGGEHEIVSDIRGIGIISGLELGKESKTNPAKYTEVAERISRLAFERGLLVARIGLERNMLRITPSLTVTKPDVDRMISVLDGIFTSIKRV